jgi:hypothetical protein
MVCEQGQQRLLFGESLSFAPVCGDSLSVREAWKRGDAALTPPKL